VTGIEMRPPVRSLVIILMKLLRFLLLMVGN